MDAVLGGFPPGSVALVVADETARIAATLAAQFTAYHALLGRGCCVISNVGASRTASWVDQLPTRAARGEPEADEAKVRAVLETRHCVRSPVSHFPGSLGDTECGVAVWQVPGPKAGPAPGSRAARPLEDPCAQPEA